MWMYIVHFPGGHVVETMENGVDEDHASDQDMTLPAILKKETDYLGMLEYNKEQEEKLLRAIITGDTSLATGQGRSSCLNISSL